MLQHLGNEAKSWLLNMLNECTRTKHIPSIWRKAKVIVIPKPGKDSSSPKSYRPCIPCKLYEWLILMCLSMRGWQKTKQASELVVHVPVSSSTWLSTSMLTGATFVGRPVSCIRHSSTPTNDKKVDGHDWRHRFMPGDSRPPQQSPPLCTAKWQEEPMEELEERTAARKCFSPATVQHLY